MALSPPLGKRFRKGGWWRGFLQRGIDSSMWMIELWQYRFHPSG